MTVIIGLLGRKRSGKDTFAARLVDAHDFTRYAFADALKDAALALDPIIEAEPGTRWDYGYGGSHESPCIESYTRLSDLVSVVGWERAKENDEVRRTLQHMGVGVRNLDPDFWLRVVMDRVRADGGNAVITDVRFPNEADAITAAGGYLARVRRPGDRDAADTHISETALDHRGVDDVIRNDGTVADLHARADTLAASVLWAEEAGGAR